MKLPVSISFLLLILIKHSPGLRAEISILSVP
jgi:hypothetical protein